MKFTGVFRELHAADANGAAYPHDHLPVAARKFRFMPVKRALLHRFGLASHWSCTHTGYWSCIRYLYKESEKKPKESLDRAYMLWASFDAGPHPVLDECCNAPLTSAAIVARRKCAEEGAVAKGKTQPRVTKLDVWPIVVQNGIRNTPDDLTAHKQLAAWVKTRGTAEMQQFLFKNRSRLSQLVDDIWEWETIEKDLVVARASRVERMRAVAAEPCECGGEWVKHVQESFRLNTIDEAALLRDVRDSMTTGRSAQTPAIVLAGRRGGEGKSFFLKAMFSAFGESHVFATPEAGTFPLVDLPGRKVIFLDEWRFNQQVLSFATQCLLYDGSIVPINRPQNDAGAKGHYSYQGSAPVFVTTKLVDIERLDRLAADDPLTGAPIDANASMLRRRLKIYPFTVRIPKPPPGIKHCGPCFSKAVLAGRFGSAGAAPAAGSAAGGAAPSAAGASRGHDWVFV